MFTVALVGADGAGKTTVAKRVAQNTDLPIQYVYMGANPESSNVRLPTTILAYLLKKALGKTKKTSLRGVVSNKPRPKGRVQRGLAGIKPYFWLVNRIAEEWFRQGVVWFYTLRGKIVIFDRHFFFDYYAYDIAQNGKGRPFPRRLHGWMLNHLYPKPDLVIFLDAPAELLFARKPEATLAYLEGRRSEYLRHRERFNNFFVVDASQPPDAVFQDVVRIIEGFRPARSRTGTGKRMETKDPDGGEQVA